MRIKQVYTPIEYMMAFLQGVNLQKQQIPYINVTIKQLCGRFGLMSQNLL